MKAAAISKTLFLLTLIFVLSVVTSGGCIFVQTKSTGEPNYTLHHGGSGSDLSLEFSFYLGGSSYDVVRDIVTDSQGNAFITGGTDSKDFPTTSGVYDSTHNGSMDAFVMKLDSAGKVIWSTLLGGPSLDRAYAIEIDSQGYVLIAGRAGADFPVTAKAFQQIFKGGPGNSVYPPQDGFVAKLAPDGSALVWASYFAATDDPSHPVRDLALDGSGDVYVASSSSTGDYPPAILSALQKGARPTRAGSRDGVVAKLKSDGSQVIWATYVGGSGAEWGSSSVRVDAAGNACYLTVTDSSDAPVTAGAYDRSFNGNVDFYLAKLSPDGARLIFGTYLGGSQGEHVETHTLEIDGQGNPLIVAGTTSSDFPTTAGALQHTYGGSGGRGTGARTNYPGDVVVAKLSADGSRLLASTYLGGRYGEAAEGVQLDRAGNVYFTGSTFSQDFPVTRGSQQPSKNGPADAFVVKLSADFSKLLYSSYLGGTEVDACRAVAVDGNGNLYVGGETTSSDWPIRSVLPAAKYSGKADGMLAKFGSAAREPKGKPAMKSPTAR